MKLIYPALIAPIDTGGYMIRVPDVPGCVTTGQDLADTLDNVRDALAGCLCALEDAGDPVPTPSTPTSICEDGFTEILVDVDLIEYRKETDTKAVRKNVSMPAWLLYLADKAGLNCSQILQDALKKHLGIA